MAQVGKGNTPSTSGGGPPDTPALTQIIVNSQQRDSGTNSDFWFQLRQALFFKKLKLVTYLVPNLLYALSGNERLVIACWTTNSRYHTLAAAEPENYPFVGPAYTIPGTGVNAGRMLPDLRTLNMNMQPAATPWLPASNDICQANAGHCVVTFPKGTPDGDTMAGAITTAIQSMLHRMVRYKQLTPEDGTTMDQFFPKDNVSVVFDAATNKMRLQYAPNTFAAIKAFGDTAVVPAVVPPQYQGVDFTSADGLTFWFGVQKTIVPNSEWVFPPPRVGVPDLLNDDPFNDMQESELQTEPTGIIPSSTSSLNDMLGLKTYYRGRSKFNVNELQREVTYEEIASQNVMGFYSSSPAHISSNVNGRNYSPVVSASAQPPGGYEINMGLPGPAEIATYNNSSAYVPDQARPPPMLVLFPREFNLLVPPSIDMQINVMDGSNIYGSKDYGLRQITLPISSPFGTSAWNTNMFQTELSNPNPTQPIDRMRISFTVDGAPISTSENAQFIFVFVAQN